MLAALALASCAPLKPGQFYVWGHYRSVTPQDIGAAVAADYDPHHPFPVDHIRVASHDEIHIFYPTHSPTYQQYSVVRRIRGRWIPTAIVIESSEPI
jgi:hypothetical protein